MDEQTPDLIAQHYFGMMDSITVIERLQTLDRITEDERDELNRNLDHIKIMLSMALDWTGFDMTRINAQVPETP